MTPVNQVFLNSNPLLNGIEDIDSQINKMLEYKKSLQKLKDCNNKSSTPIWDSIDNEISSLSVEQKDTLIKDSEYIKYYEDIQSIVQSELLNLVKSKIENSENGRNLLSKQLSTIKRIKEEYKTKLNKELMLFNKFKEFSKDNPDITYEKFIKLNSND